MMQSPVTTHQKNIIFFRNKSIWSREGHVFLARRIVTNDQWPTLYSLQNKNNKLRTFQKKEKEKKYRKICGLKSNLIWPRHMIIHDLELGRLNGEHQTQTYVHKAYGRSLPSHRKVSCTGSLRSIFSSDLSSSLMIFLVSPGFSSS